jgi:hypothetical protein
LVDNLCVFGVKAPFLKLKQVVLDTLFPYKGSKKAAQQCQELSLNAPKKRFAGG